MSSTASSLSTGFHSVGELVYAYRLHLRGRVNRADAVDEQAFRQQYLTFCAGKCSACQQGRLLAQHPERSEWARRRYSGVP